ncbi:hypothetical protein PtA15_10A211 [Puccinia triticina]|uniref:Uncharacterized protein n=1 Tax=Puccinia triticina TaxID=208348 RepID=A0ABY7CWG1_9BASI|nr:uncharacterized protein PtA15_10A211 [Puccinia triticina]WAQ88792.1 hypothetical protein PtA15_10A211 [Puccinia triticina]
MTPEGSDKPIKTGATEVLDLDAITLVPKLPKATIEAILNTTNVPPPAIEVSDDIDQERAHIWGKIKEAQQAGDEILVKYLMNASGQFSSFPRNETVHWFFFTQRPGFYTMDVSPMEPPTLLANFKDFFTDGTVERPPSLADLVLLGG